jgi:hypothetical protein
VPSALALTSPNNHGDNTWRVVWFLILEQAEPAPETTLTMKRIGFGIVNTDRDWARDFLDAPVARVMII